MNCLPKHWLRTGSREAYCAYVISYADDFTILSRGRAAEDLAWAEGGDDAARARSQRGEDLDP